MFKSEHRHIFFILCKQIWILLQWVRSQFSISFCTVLLEKAKQTGGKKLLCEFRVLLRYADMHLVMENLFSGLRWGWECVRSHMWPLAEAVGPPLVQSHTPKTSTTHLPQTHGKSSLLLDHCTYGQKEESSCVFAGSLSIFYVAIVL